MACLINKFSYSDYLTDTFNTKNNTKEYNNKIINL